MAPLGRSLSSTRKSKEMTFVYYYKTSDGVRHEAEIGAPSRDEAFSELRRQGIRPIKVIEKNPARVTPGIRKRVVFVWVVVAGVGAGALGWFFSRVTDDDVPSRSLSTEESKGVSTVTSPPPVAVMQKEEVRRTVAKPLARQRIPGDRARIERLKREAFDNPAETLLARFAEPGQEVGNLRLTPELKAAFPKVLKQPLYMKADELTEAIDLKRIVAGMKREMSAFLEAGGTVDEYLSELQKRQDIEIQHREKAEKRLAKLLGEGDPSKAYSFWLQANASLHALGIAPIPLPEELRKEQNKLGIE